MASTIRLGFFDRVAHCAASNADETIVFYCLLGVVRCWSGSSPNRHCWRSLAWFVCMVSVYDRSATWVAVWLVWAAHRPPAECVAFSADVATHGRPLALTLMPRGESSVYSRWLWRDLARSLGQVSLLGEGLQSLCVWSVWLVDAVPFVCTVCVNDICQPLLHRD